MNEDAFLEAAYEDRTDIDYWSDHFGYGDDVGEPEEWIDYIADEFDDYVRGDADRDYAVTLDAELDCE